MNKDEKTITAVMTIIATVLLPTIGLTSGWPAWLWLSLTAIPVISALAIAAAVRHHRHRQPISLPPQSPTPQPVAVPQAPPPPQYARFVDITANSATPDYDFLISGTVYWRAQQANGGTPPENGNNIACASVISRIRGILKQVPAEGYSTINEELNLELNRFAFLHNEHIEVWGRDISATLAANDRDRLQRLAEVRKAEQVWEHERNHERNVRKYLGEEVLRNPGSAVVWWLAKNESNDNSGLRKTVNDIEELRKLTAAAHATEIPQWPEPDFVEPAVGEATQEAPSAPSPGDGDGDAQSSFLFDAEPVEQTPEDHLLAYITEKVPNMPDETVTMFVDRHAKLLDAHGQEETASMLRGRYTKVAEECGNDPAEDVY